MMIRYFILLSLLFLSISTYANTDDTPVQPFAYVTTDAEGYNLQVMDLSTGDDLYMIESSDYVCPQELFTGEDPYLIYSEGIGSPTEHQFRRLDLETGITTDLPQLYHEALSDDGQYLAFENQNNQLTILDMATNVHTFTEDVSDIRHIQWNNDVLYVLAYHRDDIYLYQLQDDILTLSHQIDIPDAEVATSVQLAPSGNYLIFRTSKLTRPSDTRDWIVNLQTGEQYRLPSYAYATWHPDGTQLALTIEDDRIDIYDAQNGDITNTIDFRDTHSTYRYQSPSTVQWSPDGRHLLYSLISGGGTYASYYETHIYTISDETSRRVSQYARADVYSAFWLSDEAIIYLFSDVTAQTQEQFLQVDIVQQNIMTLERTHHMLGNAGFWCAFG